MGDKSRLSPEQPFPADLAPLEDSQVEILNSKIHRQLDREYTVDQEPDPETESRHEELQAELDFRAAEDHQPPVDVSAVQPVVPSKPRESLPEPRATAPDPKDKAPA
ncbi:hypothetical protein [Arthrobacter sp. 260]|uniref:hypothetical protein n=1 Tax=Arthrobacter sp. 260 TaxID=2735314 RepID=UPI001E2F9218|nr:hypothetical protein [Arthrobacter sp. 260]